MSKKKELVNVWLRVTNDEKITVQQNAKQAHMSVSQYVVSLVQNRPIFVIEDVAKFAVQLKKIGTNINQIANIANSQKFVNYEMRREIKEFRKEIESISKAVNKILLTVNLYRERSKSEINFDNFEIQKHLETALMLIKSRCESGSSEVNIAENSEQ